MFKNNNNMNHLQRIFHILLVLSFFLPVPFAGAEEVPAETLLRDTFYVDHAAKLKRTIFEVDDFLLVPTPSPDWNSNFSIVTGFRGSIFTSHVLRDINSVDEARDYFEKNIVLHDDGGIEIRELPLAKKNGTVMPFYWVGNRAFLSMEDARLSVQHIRNEIRNQGGNFEAAIEKVSEIAAPPPEPVEAPTRPELEEKFALKALDWLGFMDHPYGPLYGEPSGERILYQSTLETTYRTTNFSQRHFDSQVGFWSHRLVFKGIRFLEQTTIDPYVDAVTSLESNGTDFASNLELSAGMEWRPFARAKFTDNVMPGGVQILEWMKNIRFFVAYLQRKNLKDKFDDATHTYNLEAGVNVFKEWGIDLPDMFVFNRDQGMLKKSDFLWGELFMDWIFDKTNFTSGNNLNTFLTTTAFKVGVKWPRFDLPDNPINRELLFMPYFVFEDTRNSEQSRFFQNKYNYGFGVRMMPFRDYRFMNNEWLFKTKLFFEYLMDIHYTKDKPPSAVPEKDIRIGVNMSLRRF